MGFLHLPNTLAARGPALGIPTMRVDGNDVFAMYFAVKEARRIATEEGRPVLIEAMTYRISHHSTSDDSTAYRSVDEVRTWQEREHPLNRVEQLLKQKGAYNEAATTSFKEAVRKEIIDVVFQTEKQLKPPISYLFTDVYDTMSDLQRGQLAELTEHLQQYGEHYPLKNFKAEE